MIPRILHQVWVGPRPAPSEWMGSWRMDGWEYRLWSESDHPLFAWYADRGVWHGCSDVLRVEALVEHGGVYVDADSKRLRDLDPLLERPFFAIWAPFQEGERISNGFLGAVPEHPMMVDYLARITAADEWMPPWSTIGGTLLTEVVADHRLSGLVLPTAAFMHEDRHGTAVPEEGPRYAQHFYASTRSSKHSYSKGTRK